MPVNAVSESSSQRTMRKADAVVAAATRPLPSSEHRSTADQRQAFLEHLYSDYAELHTQQAEIHDRKNQMDFDLYGSNQQDIHDVLFANVEAADGALGDWDTWEKVEAAMKRYAYGRPRHTTQEKEEDAALRSRIAALDEVVRERGATIDVLTQSCTATQQELSSVLKLLHLRENEIKTLSNQFHVASLQLRYVQRENAALRGLRSEPEPSLLKQDLTYLVEANKKLEAENILLRGRQQVATGAVLETRRTTAPAAPAPPQKPTSSLVPHTAEQPSAFVALSPPTAVIDSDALDRCLEDDDFRRVYLQKEVPLSGAVVTAKRETAHWKRRLEAEVNSAMEMLDRDAAVIEAALTPTSAAFRGGKGSQQNGGAALQNGVFISYASCGTAPLMQSEQNVVPVLVAPSTTATQPLAAHPNPATAAASAGHSAPERIAESPPAPSTESREQRPIDGGSASAASPPAAAAVSSPAHHASSSATPKARRKSSTAAQKKRHSTAAADSAHTSAAHPSAKGSTAAEPRRSRASTTASSSSPATFAQLRSAVLQCAELSRANAMRRELLHVAYLRQILAEELARAAQAAEATETAEGPAWLPLSQPRLESATAAEEAAKESGSDDEAGSGDAATSSTTAAERLRQRVQESRTPSQVIRNDADGGEVQSSVAVSATHDPSSIADGPLAPSPPPPPQAQRTPTPPPLSRLHSSRQPSAAHSAMQTGSGGQRATPSASLPADAGGAVVGEISAASLLPLLQRTSDMRGDVAQLRESVVSYWAQLREALALLAELLAERERAVVEAAEERAKDSAVVGAAEQVLEEAALQRTAQILRERFGAMLPANALTPAQLPDTATDEEWLVNELRSAAAAMVKEAVQAPSAAESATTPSGDPPAPPHRPTPHGQRPYAYLTERDYFEAEILKPFRLAPDFASEANAARLRKMEMRSDGVSWGSDEDAAQAIGGGDQHSNAAAGRAVGGVDARSRNRPAPPSSWHWRVRENTNMGDGGAESRPVQPPPSRHPVTFTAASLANVSAAHATPSSDVQSIKPTVLRYVFDGAAGPAQRAVSAHIQQKTAYL